MFPTVDTISIAFSLSWILILPVDTDPPLIEDLSVISVISISPLISKSSCAKISAFPPLTFTATPVPSVSDAIFIAPFADTKMSASSTFNLPFAIMSPPFEAIVVFAFFPFGSMLLTTSNAPSVKLPSCA